MQRTGMRGNPLPFVVPPSAEEQGRSATLHGLGRIGRSASGNPHWPVPHDRSPVSSSPLSVRFPVPLCRLAPPVREQCNRSFQPRVPPLRKLPIAATEVIRAIAVATRWHVVWLARECSTGCAGLPHRGNSPGTGGYDPCHRGKTPVSPQSVFAGPSKSWAWRFITVWHGVCI